MLGASQKNMRDKLTPKRFIALVCLLCFAGILLLSVTFLALNAGHYDDGSCAAPHANNEHSSSNAGSDGICSVCALIQNTPHLLKIFSAVFMGAPVISAILFSAITFLFISAYFYWSPVELRIRTNC
jgi:hypothetical protein